MGVVGACTAGSTRGHSSASAANDPARVRQAALFIAGLLSKQDADRFQTAEIDRQEILIKSCMKGAGFEYFPKAAGSLVDFKDERDLSSLEYAKTYGFGLTTTPDFAAQSPENFSYHATLSRSRQVAYEKAESDCADAAAKQVGSEFALSAGRDKYQEITKQVSSLGEYQASLNTWKACATAAGFDYPSRDALIKTFSDRVQKIYSRVYKSPQGLKSDLSKDPGFMQLRADEISTATATFPCSQTADAVRSRLYKSILYGEDKHG